MELLAGVWNMNAELKESNCTFTFDFSKVYWNSRLQGEHERLVKKFKKDEFICDVFAGVGPFALPASKNQHSIVLANDLNPESYKYMKTNIYKNRLVDKVFPFNLDGRDFIKQSMSLLNDNELQTKLNQQKLKEKVIEQRKKYKKLGQIANDFEIKEELRANDKEFVEIEKKINQLKSKNQKTVIFPQHYVMNLPAIAIEFLGNNKNNLSIYKSIYLYFIFLK